ncbi:MAG: Rrf2 family transcriptional regulator [Myxococcota bacterium]
MPRDSRMSRVLHVLIHMDRHVEQPTSQQLSGMLGTNAVVVRRMMSGLRDQGIVAALRGRHGGWQLTKNLDVVSLLDVYNALERPTLFNIGPGSENPDCFVERAVQDRMEQTLGDAERLVLQQFANVTVADIAADFDRRMSMQPTSSYECGG